MDQQPDQPEQTDQPAAQPPAPSDHDKQSNQWAMFLHLSLLAGFVVPFAGLVAPIVIWALKKDEFPALIDHGNVVFNWILSALIYFVVCFVLTFVLIGVLGFIALGILGIVFPIIGGIKANEGQLWEYPLSIKFFK